MVNKSYKQDSPLSSGPPVSWLEVQHQMSYFPLSYVLKNIGLLFLSPVTSTFLKRLNLIDLIRSTFCPLLHSQTFTAPV